MNDSRYTGGLLLLLLLSGGCAETPSERSFGEAVRHVMWQQMHDPAASRTAGHEPVMGGDAGRLEGVLGEYRGSAGQSESVGTAVEVDVGSK
jgi:hypothetical protein